MAQSVYGGAKIASGDTLDFWEYRVHADYVPDEFIDDFLESYETEAQDDDLREYAVDFVEEEVNHVNAVARDEGVDAELLDQERIEAQCEGRKITLSNVLEGAWRGIRAGTCKERALTVHSLYSELGIPSRYYVGFYTMDDGTEAGHAWVETEDNYVADPSSVGGFFPRDSELYDDYRSGGFGIQRGL